MRAGVAGKHARGHLIFLFLLAYVARVLCFVLFFRWVVGSFVSCCCVFFVRGHLRCVFYAGGATRVPRAE